MNTTSRFPHWRQAKIKTGAFHRSRGAFAGFAISALLVLSACIQGPWDFYPKNPATFKGITLTGYAISGRPLSQVCFEPKLDLDQEATQAFAFYDSATVRVTGSFNGTIQTLTLSAENNAPNCFKGDASATVEKGQAYMLDARIAWDSAGSKVTSRLTSTAQVPASFLIRRTAAAPGIAKTGGIPENIFSVQFFAQLPPNVRDIMNKEYGDTLVKLQADTAALGRYVKVNGIKIQSRLIGLLEEDKVTYKEGDTLFYLNGALNTLSHYYTSDRSPDVSCVLVTHRFDPTGERPETRFDAILGLEPDSSEYYFPGDIRRLIVYPDFKGKGGYSVLDSIGVVNTWFQTVRNTLYFYGFEQAYTQYLSTNGLDGNGPDTRIKPVFNVSGGQGIFAGAIPDTFVVNIRTDPLTKSFSLPAVHAAYCKEKGWLSNQDCRGYYRSYCTSKVWEPKECKQDAVEACLEADLNGLPELKAACSPVAAIAKQDTTLNRKATSRFCISENFPAGNTECSAPKTQCLETKGSNPCKQNLWNFCLDRNWKPEQCQLGLVSYCKDRPRLSEILCRNADEYCRKNPSQTLCK